MATLIIENVNEKFIPTFKSLAKAINSNVKISKKIQHYEKWRNESAQALKDYKSGKLKAYQNADDVFRDIFKNE